MFTSAKEFTNAIPQLFGQDFYFKPYAMATSGNLVADINKLLDLKEGGLSRSKADKASSYPCPAPFADPKTKKVYDDWHTNKGITWKAFETNASLIGIQPTPANFFNLTDAERFKFFQLLYANKFKSYTPVALLNFYLGLWNWGGSAAATITIFTDITGLTINNYLAKFGESKTLLMMVKARIKLFESLNQPANLKGWINGALNFYYYFNPYTK